MNEDHHTVSTSSQVYNAGQPQSYNLADSLAAARNATADATYLVEEVNRCAVPRVVTPAPEQQQRQYQLYSPMSMSSDPFRSFTAPAQSPISMSSGQLGSFPAQPKPDIIRKEGEDIFPRMISLNVKGRKEDRNLLIELQKQDNILQVFREAGLSRAVNRFEWIYNGKPISVSGYKLVDGKAAPDYNLRGLNMFMRSTVEELTVWLYNTEESRKRRSCEDAGGLEKAKVSKQMSLGVEDYKRYERSSQVVLRLKNDREELVKRLKNDREDCYT